MTEDTIYKHNPTIKNVEQFKILADELIEAEPLLEVSTTALAVETRMKGDRITEVQLATKEGIIPVHAKTVIDCTGDADIAQRSGAPIQKSDELLPMTMHFRIPKHRTQQGTREELPEGFDQSPGGRRPQPLLWPRPRVFLRR